MADTKPDVTLEDRYVDVYSEAAIAVGTSLLIQNKSSQDIHIQIAATRPLATSLDGVNKRFRYTGVTTKPFEVAARYVLETDKKDKNYRVVILKNGTTVVGSGERLYVDKDNKEKPVAGFGIVVEVGTNDYIEFGISTSDGGNPEVLANDATIVIKEF